MYDQCCEPSKEGQKIPQLSDLIGKFDDRNPVSAIVRGIRRAFFLLGERTSLRAIIVGGRGSTIGHGSSLCADSVGFWSAQTEPSTNCVLNY
jgi:hypothetical protein